MLGAGMPILRPILDVADWAGPPVTSCMLSLGWRRALYLDGDEAAADNIMAWSTGIAWRARLPDVKLACACVKTSAVSCARPLKPLPALPL